MHTFASPALPPVDARLPLTQNCVLIVDDHPMCADAMAAAVRTSLQPSPQVQTSSSAEQGLAYLDSLIGRRCVVILDMRLPGLSGGDAIRAFRMHRNTLTVIAVTGSDPEWWGRMAESQGADAFISKTEPTSKVVNVLREMLNGPAPTRVPSLPEPMPGLTQRQSEVLKWMGQGIANKLIADRLGISEQTVKIHVHQIFRVLGVSNRTQAVLKAREIGLLG